MDNKNQGKKWLVAAVSPEFERRVRVQAAREGSNKSELLRRVMAAYLSQATNTTAQAANNGGQ